MIAKCLFSNKGMKTDRKPKNFERKIKRRSSLKFLKRIIIDNSNFTKNGNCVPQT